MATRFAPTTAPAGYDEDFALWSAEQSAHLRAGHWHALDIENIAEEIESLGKSDRRAITSHFRNASAHLIKLAVGNDADPRRGWWITVRRSWRDAEALLEESPSLRREVPAMFAAAWSRAMLDAVDGLDSSEEQMRATRLARPDVEQAMAIIDDADLCDLANP